MIYLICRPSPGHHRGGRVHVRARLRPGALGRGQEVPQAAHPEVARAAGVGRAEQGQGGDDSIDILGKSPNLSLIIVGVLR